MALSSRVNDATSDEAPTYHCCANNWVTAVTVVLGPQMLSLLECLKPDGGTLLVLLCMTLWIADDSDERGDPKP